MEFKNYRRSKPDWSNASCPKCGEAKGRCSQTGDGVWAICYKNFDGAKVVKDGALGRYGAHLLDPTLQAKLSTFEGSLECSQTRREVRPAKPQAPPEFLDSVYRQILKAWTISQTHQQALEEQRKLPAEEISRMLYRTADSTDSVIQPIVEMFGKRLLTVPGFFLRAGRIEFNCKPNLAIPTINFDGQVVNIRLRLDVPIGKTRYLYVSSRKYDGPPAVMSHHFVPAPYPSDNTDLWITEGEIKAHILAVKLNANAISIPGVHAWKKASDLVTRINPKEVVVAIDADWETNPQVARPLVALARALMEGGCHVRFAQW